MQNENEGLDVVEVEGKPVSLAELAGMDMSDIEAKRFFRAPLGVYVFEICLDEQDNQPPMIRALNKKAAMVMPCKIIDVLGVKDPDFEADPATLIGKIHRETQFLTSDESAKYLKAFLVDLGTTGKGPLNQILAGTVGMQFQAPIIHRRDKNDTDKVYSSIRQDKIVTGAKMKKKAA